MSKTGAQSYDPRTFKALTFHDATARFREGADSPRAYLERCLETIAEREPVVKAFASLNEASARAAADASAARWKAGRPLSAIDGMPVGIKDLLETKDMPTEMGCKAYRGNFPKRDNPAVWALRQAGAVILGKTVTAELGGAEPGPTRNPFDTTRTPGGSSSGSAAAVAARMLPAAIGTQVGGSIIRPAGFCGNVALKPTQGGINRGERQATSMSTHGVHAGSIEDMWQVAIEIAERAGGDRGSAGLFGPPRAPAAHKPERLIVLETAGWQELDGPSKSAFERVLREHREQRRAADPPRLASPDREARGGDRRCRGHLQCDHGLGEPLVASQPRRSEPGRRQRARQGRAGQSRGHVAQRLSRGPDRAGGGAAEPCADRPARRCGDNSRVPGAGAAMVRTRPPLPGRPATPSSTIQAPCCLRRP